VKLSIAGYKSIAEKRTVEISGLTILAGANSSGKSSFMQPLLLMKQTLVAKENQLVYIEEPELHLHPRAQFELAKVIASAVSERNIKVVIETHSSILIRGVQILVAKGELNPASVSLNWFTQDPNTGQTDITEAKLDKLGVFGDWPEDFDAVTLDD
jgi:predicted ATPase